MVERCAYPIDELVADLSARLTKGRAVSRVPMRFSHGICVPPSANFDLIIKKTYEFERLRVDLCVVLGNERMRADNEAAEVVRRRS